MNSCGFNEVNSGGLTIDESLEAGGKGKALKQSGEPGPFRRRLRGITWFALVVPTLVAGVLLDASAEVRYVNVNSLTPAAPYTTWATAAADIQSAVDAAAAGDLILVTNGVYATGGRAVYGAMTNRVAVTKAVTVQSVNGPELTIIRGYQVPGTTNGNGAIRCVYLADGAFLNGFTLTNGATRKTGDPREQRGGGLLCVLTNAGASNCVLTGNAAFEAGGGACEGTLNNCTLSGNSAIDGGGAVGGTLNYCTLTGNSATNSGGGAANCELNHCTLTGNSAFSVGGGASYSSLNHCTLTGNSARYVGGGAFSSGLTNCTLTGNTSFQDGGGASGGTLSNCTVAGNSASRRGGGVYRSDLLVNCTLTGNAASSGGGVCGETDYTPAVYCRLNDCIVTSNSASANGGGACYSKLNNCAMTANTASGNGGGVYSGTLTNCMLAGNVATASGGGAFQGYVVNCTLTGNSATFGGGVGGDYAGVVYNSTLAGNAATSSGGGASRIDLNNCIVYFNTAVTNGPNYFDCALNRCCTSPGDTGNITNAPLFVDLAGGNLRLQSNSPCINAGLNGYAAYSTDLDGQPRIVGGTVDIGAFECQTPAMLEYYLWLASYGLRTEAPLVYADTDRDRLNNWQEWRAGTIPTNAASVLQLLAPARDAGGVTVSWQSVSGVTYFLERSTDLVSQPAFSVLASNLVGQAGTTIYTDTNAPGTGRCFYRVGVQ